MNLKEKFAPGKNRPDNPGGRMKINFCLSKE